MKAAWLAVCVLAVFLENDCDLSGKKSEPTVSAMPVKSIPIHRFTLAEPLKDVAFDTQTGQLCRTWDWAPSDRPTDKTLFLERKIGQFAPTCLELYQKYPSTPVDAKDPLGILEK